MLFLVVILLTTISSVLTIYLKTDDCSGLSTQYKTLIENHTDLMIINNELVKDNNQKQKDFLEIKKLLESIDNTKTTKVSKSSFKNEIKPIIAYDDANESDSVMVSAMISYEPKEVIIEKETTITKVPDEQKQILSSVLDIIKKHDKK